MYFISFFVSLLFSLCLHLCLLPSCSFISLIPYPPTPPYLLNWCAIVAYQELRMWGASVCTIRGRGGKQTVVQHNGKHCYDPPTHTWTLLQFHITDLLPPAYSHFPFPTILLANMTSELPFPASESTTHARIRYVTLHIVNFHSFLARACGLENLLSLLVHKIKNNEGRVHCTVTDVHYNKENSHFFLFSRSPYDTT